jgi:hypothetical protein
MKHQKIFAIFLLNVAILFAPQTTSATYSDWQSSQILLADRYFRTELYFGTDKPGGGRVTAEEWDKFLESEVTPRFPEGFTVLEGYGQFKDSGGKIVREASLILVLFYPKKQRESVNLKIEELRANYKKKFNQESVLRLDYTKSVNVSF